MQGFLLTRHWRDSARGIQLELWFASLQGPLRVLIERQESVFFVSRAEAARLPEVLGTGAWRTAEVALSNYLGEPVLALYSRSHKRAQQWRERLAAQGIAVWEADIRPSERYLMERFITGGVTIEGQPQLLDGCPTLVDPVLRPQPHRPQLEVVSVDIETSMDARELYSIGVFGRRDRFVFMVGDRTAAAADGAEVQIQWCASAQDCLQQFFSWLAARDPDLLIGWNFIQFDLWVLEKLCRRYGMALALGRGGQACHWREERTRERRYVSIPGRVALDGIELLRAATYSFESFSLEAVARAVLGQGKLLTGKDRGRDITELFQRDKVSLAAYNLRDCELVWDVFEQTDLLAFALAKAQLTGLALDRVGGSVAAFEYAYLPRLHRAGFVAPNLGELQSDVVSPGGYVMESRPGLYDHVLVLDFKSLYPSIIRSFCIDPCAFWRAEIDRLSDADCVPGFNGARFAKQGALLPEIIRELWRAREQAKADGNSPLSQAIKIIMNSFYGVLGSPGCRFFDPRISSSITLRGHEIIQRSREWIEARDYQVIYGDTDSLFVWLEACQTDTEAQRIGSELERGLNRWWQASLKADFGVESTLEIEFETHYRKFFMPTVRGAEIGSKKRYAGVVSRAGQDEIVFKGLENVRTDWTPLARRFQLELYRRIFFNQPFATYIRTTVAEVLAGQRDEELVYRKRLRRKLDDYQKNVPPHVQAARQLRAATGARPKPGDWVSYVLTVNGPAPVQLQRRQGGPVLAYQQYIDRQLRPVADSILQVLGESFADIVDRQIRLL
ncbi:DNA polymerase II [Exilibacterium tricleocarpae]|uniref:DNA polymerase n=2 Tax=Exilibacterium tricleocarpae TaxID=2591008 RepID=A0A545T3Q1_9GAMM|nr:DNA polymerase II [Exilibacterium tricleocarpae]TQV71853.1 DNA polymerase II [Exilibacterium tricleocarpae]